MWDHTSLRTISRLNIIIISNLGSSAISMMITVIGVVTTGSIRLSSISPSRGTLRRTVRIPSNLVNITILTKKGEIIVLTIIKKGPNLRQDVTITLKRIDSNSGVTTDTTCKLRHQPCSPTNTDGNLSHLNPPLAKSGTKHRQATW